MPITTSVFQHGLVARVFVLILLDHVSGMVYMHRGSYMSDKVVFNVLNCLVKRNKIRGLLFVCKWFVMSLLGLTIKQTKGYPTTIP